MAYRFGGLSGGRAARRPQRWPSSCGPDLASLACEFALEVANTARTWANSGVELLCLMGVHRSLMSEDVRSAGVVKRRAPRCELAPLAALVTTRPSRF